MTSYHALNYIVTEVKGKGLLGLWFRVVHAQQHPCLGNLEGIHIVFGRSVDLSFRDWRLAYPKKISRMYVFVDLTFVDLVWRNDTKTEAEKREEATKLRRVL